MLSGIFSLLVAANLSSVAPVDTLDNIQTICEANLTAVVEYKDFHYIEKITKNMAPADQRVVIASCYFYNKGLLDGMKVAKDALPYLR